MRFCEKMRPFFCPISAGTFWKIRPSKERDVKSYRLVRDSCESRIRDRSPGKTYHFLKRNDKVH